MCRIALREERDLPQDLGTRLDAHDLSLKHLPEKCVRFSAKLMRGKIKPTFPGASLGVPSVCVFHRIIRNRFALFDPRL